MGNPDLAMPDGCRWLLVLALAATVHTCVLAADELDVASDGVEGREYVQSTGREYGTHGEVTHLHEVGDSAEGAPVPLAKALASLTPPAVDPNDPNCKKKTGIGPPQEPKTPDYHEIKKHAKVLSKAFEAEKKSQAEIDANRKAKEKLY